MEELLLTENEKSKNEQVVNKGNYENFLRHQRYMGQKVN
jgi:hypothetical protein